MASFNSGHSAGLNVKLRNSKRNLQVQKVCRTPLAALNISMIFNNGRLKVKDMYFQQHGKNWKSVYVEAE